MNTHSTVSTSRTLFVGLSMTLLLTASACNPTGSEEETHSEPFGLVLLTGGTVMAEQRDGAITYPDGATSIPVPAGDETPLITLRFLDEDGDRFTPDEPEYELEWSIANADVLGVHQHEDDGKWNFHLEGEQAGSTTIRFFLMHSGHSDFESLDFNVTVQ